jgi:hypothetical protein
MMPWEREGVIGLLLNYIKERKEKMQNQNR